MKEQQNILKPDKRFCVYRHTSPSGKCYIGITSTNPIARWGKYGQRYKDCPYIYHAILKYGWSNIKHEILFTDLTEKEAKNIEVYLIAYYKGLNQSYNISAGGDGCSKPVSETTREKISKKLKGRKSYTRTALWRRQKSEFMKKHPIFTDEMRKLAQHNSARTNSKAIIQMTLEGAVVARYKSVTEAAAVNNFDVSYISKCCRHIKKEAYGYKWMFI